MDAVQIIITQSAAETAGQSAIAYGALKFFAERVFGPSADAIGENLRHVLANVSGIFALAGEKAESKGIEPCPISPGLLSRMIMDAAFSENDPDIKDWWANLFVDASIDSSNIHAVFSDIMAMLGPQEAKFLSEFVMSFPSCSGESFGQNASYMDTLNSKFEGAIEAWMNIEDPVDNYGQVITNFLSGDPSWPMRPTEWRIPARIEGSDSRLWYGHNPWFTNNLVQVDILKRTGLLTSLDASFSVWGGMNWVRGVGLSPLGYEFYRTCTGRKSHD